MQLLADPAFFGLIRKLLAHRALRVVVDRLAANFPEPLDESG
jgi:hypothetical protein